MYRLLFFLFWEVGVGLGFIFVVVCLFVLLSIESMNVLGLFCIYNNKIKHRKDTVYDFFLLCLPVPPVRNFKLRRGHEINKLISPAIVGFLKIFLLLLLF